MPQYLRSNYLRSKRQKEAILGVTPLVCGSLERALAMCLPTPLEVDSLGLRVNTMCWRISRTEHNSLWRKIKGV